MPSDAVNSVFKQLVNSATDVIFTLAVQNKPEITLDRTADCTGVDLSGHIGKEYIFSANFSGIDNGRLIVTLPVELALNLAGSLMGSDKPENFESAEKSAIYELMNNMSTNWAGLLKEMLSIYINVSDQEIHDPGTYTVDTDELWSEGIVTVSYGEEKFSLSVLLSAEMTKLMDENIEKEAAPEIDAGVEPDPVVVEPAEKPAEKTRETVSKPVTVAAKTSQPADHEDHKITKPSENVNIRQAQFQQLQQELADLQESKVDKPIELILDVPLLVSVELGRKDLTIKEILELSPGSLIELNQLAGEPVDLLINGKLFARGEVVVIDENFGIRVTHIISPKERLEKLR